MFHHYLIDEKHLSECINQFSNIFAPTVIFIYTLYVFCTYQVYILPFESNVKRLHVYVTEFEFCLFRGYPAYVLDMIVNKGNDNYIFI